MNKLQAADGTAPPARLAPEDEISLVDVALVIWRHRWAALVTLLVVSALGLTVALLLPRKYVYTTTIEIGTRVEDGRVVPIEAPDTTLAKLRESYIPRERQRYREAHPDERRLFKTAARLPNGSQLLALEGTATVNESAAYKSIQEQVVQALVADHARVFEGQRRAVELSKQRAERDVQALVDAEVVLKGRIERLKSTAQLIERQITDIQRLIEDATANRRRAVAEARNEAPAMTLLMLDSEVQENRKRLADLQQQLQIGLAEQRDTLQSDLQQNRRDQVLQQAEVQRLDQQLKNLKETRAMVQGLQSVEPVGISRSLMLGLSVVLGSFLALLLPLVLEFMRRVRESVVATERVASTGLE